MDCQRLLPIPSRSKLLQGLAVVGQLLGASLEPEADNSTTDLDHLERRLGGGQQQALLGVIRDAGADQFFAGAAVFSTRHSVVFWVLLDKSGVTSTVEWGKVSRLAVTAAVLSASVWTICAMGCPRMMDDGALCMQMHAFAMQHK